MKEVVSSLFLLCNLVLFGQLNQAEIAVQNYTDLSAIRQYDKFELGVRLPNQQQQRIANFLREANVPSSEMINPFLEWELAIDAEFVHGETGLRKRIPAFYYREYERDPETDSWRDIGTMYPMRVRFAPPLTGEWTCTVHARIKGKKLEMPAPLVFTVIPGTKSGFVTVHPNKRNFQLAGKMIYPVGVNFPCPTKGVPNYHTGPDGDLFGPKETYKVTRLHHWMEYLDDIRKYADSGGRFIRTLQSGWSSLLEFEKKGNYYDRQPYAWEQDRLLELCEERGVYIDFNLMQQEPFMKYGNYDLFDWDWSHYNRDHSYKDYKTFPAYCYSEGEKKEPHESLLSDDDMRYHEQRTRYYIARYGYSTSIYLFELFSEPWHVNEFSGSPEPFTIDDEAGKEVRRAVRNYHERLAVYIKHGLGHTNQLIGIDVYTAKYYEGELFLDQSVYHPDIDVVSFNPYAAVPDKLIITKSADNNAILPNENSMARLVLTLQQKCGKPVMIAEGGASDGVDDCSGFAQHYLDMMTFGFSGLAGYNSWVGWNYTQDSIWRSMIGAQQFMNGSGVLSVLENGNGYWVQGREAARHLRRDRKNGKEIQYYIAQDGCSAAGYVKNRSFNFLTKSTGGYCSSVQMETPFDALRDMRWDDGNRPLTVEGLDRSKRYSIAWYDYITGEPIETQQCIKARRGRIRPQFPELSVTPGKPERPVLWFTIRETGCR